MALANRRTNRSACLEHFVDKLSFKTNSMSLGLVVSEEKSLTCTRTYTPQNDAIMSADINKRRVPVNGHCVS